MTLKIQAPDIDWFAQRKYTEVFIVQSSYYQNSDICHNVSPNREGAIELANIGTSSVAIFHVIKKSFVNQNGELV